VASLLLERFRAPDGTRDTRALDSARKRAVAALAGRTVWCAGGTAARRLRGRLEWADGDGVAAAWLRAPDAEDLEAYVRPDDIVVLHHRLTASPAEAIRDRGAHAVWLVVAPREPAPAIDAYVMTGRAGDETQVVAALMPWAGVVTAKETHGGGTYLDVAWTSLLADVVRMGREECVGGTLHARPAVAAR